MDQYLRECATQGEVSVVAGTNMVLYAGLANKAPRLPINYFVES